VADIIWLASYPRSGNTWFRIFLSNLLHPSDCPVNINGLPERNTIASARDVFDEITCLCAGDLTFDEIDRLRPRVYETMAAESKKRLYLKIHDAYTLTPDGEPLVSTTATAGVIYIVRNPLDVAISRAHHTSCSIDKAIDEMANMESMLMGSHCKLGKQLRQRLLGWSGHVASWLGAPGVPIHVVHYEDMQARPLEVFHAAARFAGIDCDADAVRTAVERSSFQELQKQERRGGFRERLPQTAVFFRAGKVGGWRQTLSPKQVDRIIQDHGAAMRRLGYFDADGDVIDEHHADRGSMEPSVTIDV